MKFKLLCCLLLSWLTVDRCEADPWSADVRLGHGVNMLGYDRVWDDPSHATIQPGDFARVRRHGFSNVRFNLRAFSHMDDANRLDPAWLATLDSMLQQARSAGLMVILDEHDHDICADDVATCRVKLLAFWRQVGDRYRTAPSEVLFELLNEPHGQLTASVWNVLLAEVLRVVRLTNPNRVVLVGPTEANSYRGLPGLVLPPAPNLIVTVHYYDPFTYTHQGAGWTSLADSVGATWGTPADRARVAQDFATIANWGEAHYRPMHLGEFGTYDKAPMVDRVAWTSTVAGAAEAQGMPWTYWQFEGSFGAFDPLTRSWIAPIARALR